MNRKDNTTPPRGILKSSPAHQPRSSSCSDHARRVTATSSDSSCESLRGEGTRVTDVCIPSRNPSGTRDHLCSSSPLAQTRSRPRWIQFLLSIFSAKRNQPFRPATPSVQRPIIQRTANVPTPVPSSCRSPVMSSSQISLPYSKPRRKRALSDLGAVPGCQAPRANGRRSNPKSSAHLLSVTGNRRLGSFDFER
ncbi:hypothetical protein BC835DRAFT_1371867 [Cytidiella melzeri]|nr:hypothetical protein BC835DRAFT_1371867 [Cytidiella melzeri]